MSYIAVNGKEIKDNQTYTLATSSYIGGGGDGYSMLKNCKVKVD